LEASKGASTLRRRSRLICLRALYRWDVTGDPLEIITAEILADAKVRDDVRDFAGHLLSLVHTGLETIDQEITAALDRWTLERLAVTDRSVLRMATAELLFNPQVPTSVILNEAIEIAAKYGSPKSGSFVNGVLDKVASNVRSAS